MTALLRLGGVGKRYGDGDFVVRDVDFAVEPGRVIGILGANGSGKSTLLRIMAGVSRATTGTLEGTPSIGYLPDRFPAGQRMSARAYLRHMARIRGLADLSVIDALIERLAVVGGPKAQLRTLSKGNAQKIGLAQAVMARPELLILDEPWSGLDVGMHVVLGEIVAETKARGASVVFTDHRPEVVRKHADVVYRIEKGRFSAEDAGPAERVRVVLEVDAVQVENVLGRAKEDGWSVQEVTSWSR